MQQDLNQERLKNQAGSDDYKGQTLKLPFVWEAFREGEYQGCRDRSPQSAEHDGGLPEKGQLNPKNPQDSESSIHNDHAEEKKQEDSGHHGP
jgi:hypothetical protein